MSLIEERKIEIVKIIKESLRAKLQNYSPETSYKPFHHRLLGKDRMALHSFIHSLNTAFGTSIYEPVAELLASQNFPFAKKQYDIGNSISVKAQAEIQKIIDDISAGKSSQKNNEVERIRLVCKTGEMATSKPVKVDIIIKDNNNVVHLFDLKTVKPNISAFKDFKRTLLEWTAIYLTREPTAIVCSYIGIPYNPYHPKPYERWTIKGMFDAENEFKIGEELWNFFGGSDVYDDLLGCFEVAGKELREEIDKTFSKFTKLAIE